MTKRIWTGTCFAVVGLATAAITAQTPASPQTATPTPQQSTAASSAQRVTVTGCLKAEPSSSADANAAATGTAGTAGSTATAGTSGTAGAAGTAGSAGAAGTTAGAAASTPAADQKFILEDASASSADTTAAAAGAGTTAEATGAKPSASPSASASGAKQTYYLIANPSALSPHIGKKLELTGTIEEANSSAQPSEAAGAHPSASPKLRVEAGKVVAASCSQ
jgi:hypothetical protein